MSNELKLSHIQQQVKPIIVNGIEVQELEMRRPTLRDQISAARYKGTDEEKEAQMMAQLCEVAPDEFYALDLEDYAQMQEAYTDFLPSLKDRFERSLSR